MTEEAFNPKDHMWSFTGYCKYEFSFIQEVAEEEEDHEF